MTDVRVAHFTDLADGARYAEAMLAVYRHAAGRGVHPAPALVPVA